MRFLLSTVVFTHLFLISCVVQVPKEPLPTWVQERPITSFYYIGIAKVEKSQYPSNYRQIAKKIALNDLASEISIKIESNSLVSSYDDQSGFQSDFSQFIKTEINKNLTGYQMEGEYENKTMYFVYYRLSKSQWASIQADRKRVATDNAYRIFQQAQKAEYEKHYITATKSYIQALLSLKKYWNERILYTIDGKEMQLDNTIKTQLVNLLSDIQLKVTPSQIRLDSRHNYQEHLQIAVTNKKGDFLSSFPIILSYRQRNAPKIIYLSSEEKKIDLSIENVNYHLTNNSVEIKIDKQKIFDFKRENYSFFQFINDAFRVNTVLVPIQYIKPKIYIQATKHPFDYYLSQKLQEGLQEEHLQVVAKKKEADFILKISSLESKNRQVSHQKFKLAYINYTIQIFKANNQQVYTKTITQTKGVDLDYQKALEKAYIKASNAIKNEYIDDIITVFF